MIFSERGVFVMIDLFECCGEIASVGIIVDFSEDTETYIVGTPADIKAWAYGDCPLKAPKGLMRHSNKAGNGCVNPKAGRFHKSCHSIMMDISFF